MQFFRDIDVYMHYDSSYYKLHVMDISFNQTFKQRGSKQKTLHDTAALIEASEINEANPAKFDMQILMLDESSRYQHKPLELLLTNSGDTLQTFDLYIDPSTASDSSRKMYKLSTCVLESGAFEISRQEALTISFSGSASKMERINYSSFSIGSYDSTPAYSFPRATTVTVDSTVLENVIGLTLEVQNKITWTKNNTVHSSLSATSATNSTYPTSFVLTGREVAGNITTYIGSQASDLQTWKENIAISIKTGLASNNYQLQAALTPCSFTNRINPSEVFSQAYDFRMIGSPTNLNSLFTY